MPRDYDVYPVPGAVLRPGLRRYRSELRVGPQRSTATVVERVETVEGGWRIRAEIHSPMGATYDEVIVAADGLRPLSRRAGQGGVGLELRYADASVRGHTTVHGKRSPVAATLPGRLLSDGAAEPYAVAALPLEPGYGGPIWRFDTHLHRAKAGELRVLRKQLVRTPEAMLEAFVVELVDLERLPGSSRSVYHVECAAERRVLRVRTYLNDGQEMDQLLLGEE